MKRICEIYDISKDYEMPTGTVLIIVSDIEKDKIISMLLNTEMKEDKIGRASCRERVSSPV